MTNRTTFTRASATGNLQSLVTNYNANLDALEVELENSLSRKDNILPNSMEDELDMNGNDIINVNEIGVSALTINGTPVQPFAGVTVASAFQSYTFTATLGQTSFSIAPFTAYVASVQVEVNGLALPPADISVSGTNVIIPACTAGDEVVIRRYTSAPSPFPSASDITFNQAGTVNTRSVQSKLRDTISVKDFGAVGDGITNDTTAIQNAINTGKRIFLPAGTYLCNVVIANKTIIEGEGSTITIVKPFSVATAAMTFTSLGDYWSYHSEVTGIGFHGIGTKTGVGFTFGATTQAGFFTNAQYANNVKFFGCRFYNLEKGVQFPFGNIGTEFYSCGFSSNKYGVYTKNNSAGGDAMHAGNKYFFAGEFSGNECGFYCHDNQDGFGAIVFQNTIFEYNLMAAYIYSNAKTYVPIKFDSVWFEGNGQMSSGAATVTIDAWSGSTRSDQTLTKRTLILDGNKANYQFNSCGLVTDVYVKGTYTTIIANDCRVERSSGFSGNACTIDNPDSSSIRLINPQTDGGFPINDSVVTVGYPSNSNRPTINSDITSSQARWFITEQRSAKVASFGPSRAMSSALTSVATTSGTFNLTGSVVSDGRIYASCNEFTRAAFVNNEYTALNSPDSIITTLAGWYVFTLDFKRTAGNPKIFIWDRSTAQFCSAMQSPALNKWYTLAAIGYSAGSQQLFLDFSGGDVTETCTWRVSAYQIHRFDTLEQAQSFLMSGAFAES